MSRKDFGSREEYKEYKSDINASKDTAKDLAKSITAEANIQASIDDFKATDPTNFDKANNLTFKDSDGTIYFNGRFMPIL